MLKKSLSTLLATGLVASATLWAPQASASEPFLGEIKMVGFNFAPRGWAHCDGQLLAISSNSALFALLGTTYGGDGRTTFGLPDLRGRSAVHPGTGPGLSTIRQGEKSGAETRTLTVTNLPSHNHTATLRGYNAVGNQTTPSGNSLASAGRLTTYSSNAPDVNMNTSSITVGNSGGSQAFSIRDPYLGVYHVIALQGIFPSRS